MGVSKFVLKLRLYKDERLPLSGRVRDLHPLERAHGAQTEKRTTNKPFSYNGNFIVTLAPLVSMELSSRSFPLCCFIMLSTIYNPIP